MVLISSRSNPKVKFIRSLRQRKHREAAGLLLVEGIRQVGEAVEAGARIHTLVYAPELLTSVFATSLIEQQASSGLAVLACTAEVFATLSDRENPQGLLAVVYLEQADLEGLNPGNFPWAVALVAPQDPGNVGTILRTLDAVGANGLVLLESSVELGHPSLVRASMGALFWQPVAQASFAQFSRWVRGHGYAVVGTSAHASLDYRAVPPYQLPLVLLMGSEREGLTAEQAGICDLLVSLPMRGKTTSLNLAVATGVMLYSMLERFSG
jgi:TrmH family RNA methyltransferase